MNLKSVIFDAIKLRLVVYVCPQRTWCPWNVVMSILYAQRILVHILFHSFLYPLFSVYLHCKPLYSASRQPTEISESRKDKRNDTVPADIDTVIFFLSQFYFDCRIFTAAYLMESLHDRTIHTVMVLWALLCYISMFWIYLQALSAAKHTSCSFILLNTAVEVWWKNKSLLDPW